MAGVYPRGESLMIMPPAAGPYSSIERSAHEDRDLDGPLPHPIRADDPPGEHVELQELRTVRRQAERDEPDQDIGVLAEILEQPDRVVQVVHGTGVRLPQQPLFDRELLGTLRSRRPY